MPAAASVLADLPNRRFPQLPLDCGKGPDPGIVDVEQWRDWTRMETTPDQLRIEDYLDCFDLSDKRILHIGIGNSGLAERFAKRALEIVGTTIVEAEAIHGAELALPNYKAVVHNKYCGEDEAIAGDFDFIVDNNPTTFCCCLKHFALMLEFYASHLSSDGQIVTERVGLGWTTDAPDSNPRWGFIFQDLAEAAPLFGLGAHRIGSSIIVLSFAPPKKPSPARRLSQKLRSLARRAIRKIRG